MGRPRKEDKLQPMTFRGTPEQREALEREADQSGKTASTVIREAVAEYLAKKEERG